MRRLLLDTGVASALIHQIGDIPDRVHRETLKRSRVGLCTPVVGELFFGVEYSKHRDDNHTLLVKSLRKFLVWPFNRAAAEIYGRLFARLRRTGRPMQQVDVQIAAIALSLGNCEVISTDSDFLAIPGLKVVNWSDPS